MEEQSVKRMVDLLDLRIEEHENKDEERWTRFDTPRKCKN
jgi:hypothetical protein